MAAIQNKRYFYQEKPYVSLWDKFLFLIKVPIALPRLIISFILARFMAHIVLSPALITEQKPIHLIYLSDDSKEKGNVIINLVRKDPHKGVHDYFLKLRSIFSFSPLTSKRRLMHLKNHKDKAYIDSLISEIGLLHAGQSMLEKCSGKQFDWNEIHLKGLEYLDDELYDYLFLQLKADCAWVEEKPLVTRINFYTLETYHGAVLDSIALSSVSEEQKSISDRKFIIVCLANGQNYIDWIKDFNYSAKEIGCTVIGFNYRGIDYSQGMIWTEENMIQDTMAQIKHLLALGVKPEHIGIEGMCVGAAVATIAAAEAHKNNIKVKLYNERSFRSIPRVFAGFALAGLHHSLWNPINWLRYFVAGLVYLFCTPLIWISGWYMDVTSAWNKIPLADKGYSVVRNVHDLDPTVSIEDGLIEDSWASLASLMDNKRLAVTKKAHSGQALTDEEQLLLIDNPARHYFKVNPLFLNKNKVPHVIARRHLIQSDGTSPLTMHQDMIEHFKSAFFKTAPTSVLSSNTSYQEIDNHALSI